MTTKIATSQVPLITSAGEAIGAAREFAASIAPGVVARDQAGTVPARELAALDSSGLLGITVPGADSGPDLPPSVLAEVVRIIAAVDPAIAQVPQSHFLFVDVLAVYGTQHQRLRLLGDVLVGARLANGLAERGGQHAQDLRTRLTGGSVGGVGGSVGGVGGSSLGGGGSLGGGSSSVGGGGARLTGRKYYCTGALTARWLGVSALDERDRLVLAFTERDAPGVHLDADWNAMGQRGTVSGGARFDDVPVDPCLVVPYQQAFERPQLLGARTQLVHAAIQVGIAGGALRDAGWFVRDKARPFFEAARAGWAETAGRDPHTVRRFGELVTRVRAAEALLGAAGDVLDELGRVPRDAAAAARGSVAVAQAKAFGSEVAVEVASELFALAGASAADEKHDLSRHWRNARTHASHDPVSWKYYHVGNYLLNDMFPPNHGQI